VDDSFAAEAPDWKTLANQLAVSVAVADAACASPTFGSPRRAWDADCSKNIGGAAFENVVYLGPASVLEEAFGSRVTWIAAHSAEPSNAWSSHPAQARAPLKATRESNGSRSN